MKEIPVHIVVLQFARDPDVAEDDPINWNWDMILGGDGVHNPHYVTGGVLGQVEIPTSEDVG